MSISPWSPTNCSVTGRFQAPCRVGKAQCAAVVGGARLQAQVCMREPCGDRRGEPNSGDQVLVAGGCLVEVVDCLFFDPGIRKGASCACRHAGWRSGRKGHALENASGYGGFGNHGEDPHRFSALALQGRNSNNPLQKLHPGQPSGGSWARRGSGAWYLLLGNAGHWSCTSTLRRIGGGRGVGAGNCIRRGDRYNRALLVMEWPTDPGAIASTRSFPLAVVARGSSGGPGACPRHHLIPSAGTGCQYSVVANLVSPRRWYQRGKPFE
jgi:hypothetical protein